MLLLSCAVCDLNKKRTNRELLDLSLKNTRNTLVWFTKWEADVKQFSHQAFLQSFWCMNLKTKMNVVKVLLKTHRSTNIFIVFSFILSVLLWYIRMRKHFRILCISNCSFLLIDLIHTGASHDATTVTGARTNLFQQVATNSLDLVTE